MGTVRITGGAARGRTLVVADRPGLRPTSGRVREALFSVVGQDLRGLRVLDAYGGSGLLGLEAWSRGASVTTVERDRRTAAAIRDVVSAWGADVTVVEADCLRWAAPGDVFDGVLVDPPYALDPGPILQALAPLAGAWLVLESAADTLAPALVGHLSRDRVRGFGSTALHVYRP